MKKRSIAGAATGAIAAIVAAAALAGESVDERREVSSEPIISIENVRGEVEVIGWDRNEVTIDGELDDLAEELVFEVDGSQVRIEVRMPRKNVNWGDGSDLSIQVPHGSRIDFEGVSTDFRLEQVQGGARLRTVSGDIDIEAVEGRLIINTVSGDVHVVDATDRAQVTTISGEIELTSRGRSLQVATVSGDVEVDLAEFEQLKGRSVSGELEFSGNLAADGDVEIESVSGDVALRLARPVDAELDITAGIGGEIINSLTDDEPVDVFPARQELKSRAGGGAGRIRISTVSADVRVGSE